jgi:hypothetical protein
MNYLVTEGHVEAAKTFERESGTASTMDLGTIQVRTPPSTCLGIPSSL